MGEYPWDSLLRDIGEWVGGSKGMVLGMAQGSSYGSSLNWNHDPQELDRYNSHYNKLDPRLPFSRKTALHSCQLGQQYVRNEDIADTEYFDAISLRGNVCDSVHGIIADDTEIGRHAISIQRGFEEDFFERSHARQLQALLMPLEQAVRDSIRVARVSGDMAPAERLLYALIDPGLNLQCFDRPELAAQDWRDYGFSIEGRRFVPDNQRHAGVLERAVRLGISGHASNLRIGRLEISISAVPAPLGWAGDNCAFLSVCLPDSKNRTATELFALAHDFSDREQAILGELLGGAPMRDAASQLGMGYETLRWHVKNMCHKSGYARREAMVLAALTGEIST
ncbi:hypothetical protein AAV99_07410 [Aurantiacibacter marinus]|uniref:HTH luxR-type domain-containing protein n=2 Tax=Aurantiacibacter marinus TaxID=874156 RepID=A0A0H0XMK2_9SPHN|nr:hypothetical protein AAV99_07410 [Aurantiacibacter marinus]